MVKSIERDDFLNKRFLKAFIYPDVALIDND